MKKIVTLLIFVVGILPFTSCEVFSQAKRVSGNGNVVKENREVNNFKGISASSGIKIYFFQSDETKVIVEADENLHECIKIQEKNDVLHCSIDCSVRRSKAMNIYVSTPHINSISASSGADVYGETIIVSDEIRLNTSSGADIKVELQAGNVNCNASSGGDIVILGSCDIFKGTASSAGDIKASELQAKHAELVSSSGSDIQITVGETIKATANSGGDISYFGNPNPVNIYQSSGGNIKQRK
jgi:hypothetical protein